jgi:hypothetical protein
LAKFRSCPKEDDQTPILCRIHFDFTLNAVNDNDEAKVRDYLARKIHRLPHPVANLSGVKNGGQSMTPILATVTATEKRGDQYQVIVQISRKYRGSFNTLAFGDIKPHSGSLRNCRLDLVYYQNPGFNIGDPFPLWTLH